MLGIIAAEKLEMEAIKEYMTDIVTSQIFDLTFIKGKIDECECVLVECGIGKVNASRTAQIMIDKYSPDYIINVGSAGSTIDSLMVGDIIVGTKLIQYDFDASDLGNYAKGEVCGVGRFFESDKKLVDICSSYTDEYRDSNSILLGTIGTADLFLCDSQKSKALYDELGIMCVEMEGGAIAQACFLSQVPFLVVRGISDVPNGNNKIDFHTYLELASKKAGKIVYYIAKKII